MKNCFACLLSSNWYYIIILFLILFGFTNLATANSYDSLEYNLSLANIKDLVLKVEVTLKGKFKNKLVLDLPSKWAGTSYIKQIKNIQVSPKYKLKLIKKNNEHQAIITISNFSDQLKISYEIHQKAGDPSNVHEAIIRNSLVHSPGYGVFATPYDLNKNDKIHIMINWQDMEQEWKTISSYGINSNLDLNINILELIHAIYVAGKIRMYKIDTNYHPVFLSFYGNFDIEDNKIVSDLARIINSQRKFFNDFDFSYYAISLIEGDNPRSMGGTRLSNSFTGFLPKGLPAINYYILFAHEHMHNWIGGKIRNNEDEELNYWWTEGFTDFYSRLIALRSKDIDRDIFIKELNQFLREYYLSLVNQEPNSRIKKDLWNNYDIERLPYYRGFVFAIYLNNMIKQQNRFHSLDNIMYDLFNCASEQPFSSNLFKNIAHKYIKDGVDKEISNFIDQGYVIPLGGIELPIEKTLMGRYYLGFSKDIFLKSKIIKNIDVRSSAYKAGLRNSQKIISYDIPNGIGDPNKIITIRTKDKTFQFKPEHYNKVEVYQVKQVLSKDEKQQFNEFFGIK